MMAGLVRLMHMMGSVHKVRLEPPVIGIQDLISASYDEACDYAVAIAANMDRVLIDATGRMGPEECEIMVAEYRLRKMADKEG